MLSGLVDAVKRLFHAKRTDLPAGLPSMARTAELEGAPNFLLLVAVSPPWWTIFWTATTIVLIVVLVLQLVAEVPAADGVRSPIVLHPYAIDGGTCADWDSLWRRIRTALDGLRLQVLACEMIDPRQGRSGKWVRGEVAVVVDPHFPKPSASDMFALASGTAPVLIFNPLTANSYSGLHELLHYKLGHLAIGVTDQVLHQVTNVALDTFIILPAMLWHLHRAATCLAFALCSVLALYLSKRWYKSAPSKARQGRNI